MFAKVGKIYRKFIKSLNKRKAFITSFCRILFSKKEQKKGILFITGLYLKSGGVEKRLKQYSAVWEKEGYNVYVAATEKRKNSQKEDLFLSNKELFNDVLIKFFILKKNIKVVEWEAGGSAPPPINLKKIKREGALFGSIIHAARAEWKYSYLNNADYVFCISPVMGRRVPLLAKYPVLPNAVYLVSPVWSFCSQKKALFVSRLSPEKLPSIESFVSFCLSHHLAFDIAGDISSDAGCEIKELLQKKYILEESCFLGEIATVPFLKEHIHDYLFVGGVGQVILEAGMLGYPCLVCSLLGMEKSFFVTKENFLKAYQTNFSPHTKQENLSLSDAVFQIKNDFSLLCSGEVDNFIISNDTSH